MAVNGTITTEGAAYLSLRISQMAAVNIDHFVLANVPDIDESTPADQDYVLPEEYIVATAPVYRLSHNGENSVVYSMVLDGTAGDYNFNWYGLVTETGVKLAFAHIPMVAKRANVGQVINRNFIVPFTAAKALTGADIPAESWQFDFTETIAEVTVSILGPTFLYAGDTYTYTFTDWDDFSNYSVSSSVGTATLSNAELTLEIPEGTPEGECLLTIIRNGSTRVIPIRIGDPIVAPPTLISPINNAIDIVEQPTLTMSPFKTFPANVDTQLSADWELYDANDNLVYSRYDDTENLVALKIPEGILTEGGYGYKWRGRKKGVVLGDSEWTGFFTFTTASQFIKPGVLIGGDVVVFQHDSYWYLAAPLDMRVLVRFYAVPINQEISLGRRSDNAFSDSYNGFERTEAYVNEYPYPASGAVDSSYLYCWENGYFLPNRVEVQLLFQNIDELGEDELNELSIAAIKNGSWRLGTSTEYSGSESWFYSADSDTLSHGVKDGRSRIIPMRRIPV
ncbi:phage tail protein [Marinomonas sp. RSW2]|uniref:Phage tail protein n=1 Tax=Marinomonas maritima TaxID=2940935 RepID=A0ABT5WGE4_9GAMM|nr:phage tail protein [Marinomonas maritima]MDE8603889.1 phage tail protein [Marinomonas maritima]